MIVVGVDPGKEGAIACISENGAEAEPMPLIGKEIDGRYFVNWLRDRDPDLVIVEKVGAMPGNGGVSMFTFGKGYGLILGVLEAGGYAYRLATPQSWKKVVLSGTSRDKTAAIEHVHRRYPEVNLTPGKKRIPHDGMADAVCIAEYALAGREVTL